MRKETTLDMNKVTSNPIWDNNKKLVTERNKTGRNEKCYCGSGKKYKKCCLNTNPIQHLINMIGEDRVGITKERKVIVGVDTNDSFMSLENTFSPRVKSTPIEDIRFIDINDIKDYNSLWELTETGWDSKDGKKYPYIMIDNEWWNWDNSDFVRVNCNTFLWSKDNHEKYYSFIMKNGGKQPIITLGEDSVGVGCFDFNKGGK